MENETLIMNLPPRIPFKMNEYQKENLKEEDIKLIDNIIEYIEAHLFTWKKEDENFIFNLPKTLFPEKTEINYGNYEKLDVDYQQNELILSSQQISEIWKRGEFTVESKIPGLPYVWKLSEWTVKGTENIKESFFNDLGNVFYLLYKFKYRIISSGNYFDLSFQTSISMIFKGIGQILNLIVGISRKNLNNSRISKIEELINREHTKQLVIKLKENNNNFDYSIIFPQKKKDFEIIQSEFEKKWITDSLLHEQEMFDKQIPESEIRKKLIKLKNEKLFTHLSVALQNDEIAKIELLNALRALLIYHKLNSKFEATCDEERKKLHSQIRSSFYIRSRESEWFMNRMDSEFEPIQKRLEIERYDKIILKFSQLVKYKTIFIENQLKIKEHQNLMEMYSQNYDNDLPPKFVPCMEYMVTRHLFPPYEVKQIIDIDNKIRYEMVRIREYTIHSKYFFWRIWLLFARMFSWSLNIAFYMFMTAWNSSFGLKSLCYQDIYMDLSCNSETGELFETKRVFTYISSVTNLFEWINANRTKFESSPDTGFFGKNVARLFDLFINYILIMIFLGFFVIIIYPILIILYSIFAIIVGLTCFVWGILFSLFVHLFHIFIYDFDAPRRYEDCHLFAMVSAIIYDFLFLGFLQFFLCIILTILQPIIAVIVLVFSLIRIVFRFLYDILMFNLIKCCARLPKTDSGMAWKIKGPGLSKQYYNHIKLEDALLIVRGHLEELQLESYKYKYFKVLDEPREIISNHIGKTLSKAMCSMEDIKDLTTTINHYRDILDKQIHSIISNFPRILKQIGPFTIDKDGTRILNRRVLPDYGESYQFNDDENIKELIPQKRPRKISKNNVKFTKEELYAFKLASQELIKNFVENEKFDDIWTQHSLVPNTWNRLNDYIISTCINSEINLPLDELDFKIELVPKYSSSVEQSKVALLEGNPNVKNLIIRKRHEDNNSSVTLPLELKSYMINTFPFQIELTYLPKEISSKYDKEIDSIEK